MGKNMRTNFSACRGEQNNNTGEGPQFNGNKFDAPVNFYCLQPYELLEKILASQLTATPTYLRSAQSLALQEKSSDAKENSQSVATTLEREIHRFPLPPTPGPDHFTQLAPVFGELEGRQGLLLDSHQPHNILAQSVVRVLSNTEKRPPLDSTLVQVSLVELFLSLHLLEGREDPLLSLQRVSDAGRSERQKGISQWLLIQFVPDVGEDLFEKPQYRDTEKGLPYSGGSFIDEVPQGMGRAARISPPGGCCRIPGPETIPKNNNLNAEPAYDEVDDRAPLPSPVEKHPMRGHATVPKDKGNWKDRSTKPVARASQLNSTQSPRQLDPPSTPDASVMSERVRKSIDNKVRQILMAGILKPQRNPGTVCLTPAHPREGSYKIYCRGENAASRSRQCYMTEVPFLQVQCENIIIVKRLVLAEFTDWTQTLECNVCRHNHKDWIAALDADIKASVQAWARLLETAFETSQVPKIGFSRDIHRWRKWASETAK